jgi:hypothetical protein
MISGSVRGRSGWFWSSAMVYPKWLIRKANYRSSMWDRRVSPQAALCRYAVRR